MIASFPAVCGHPGHLIWHRTTSSCGATSKRKCTSIIHALSQNWKLILRRLSKKSLKPCWNGSFPTWYVVSSVVSWMKGSVRIFYVKETQIYFFNIFHMVFHWPGCVIRGSPCIWGLELQQDFRESHKISHKILRIMIQLYLSPNRSFWIHSCIL